MSSPPTSPATASVAPAHHDENQLMVERREKLAVLRQHSSVRSSPGRDSAGHRTRSAAEQRLLDVALAMSRQGIRPAPVRRG